MLTPQDVKPGWNKLQAIKHAKPPTNVKMVLSFVGLCNFFCAHIKDFAAIAAPVFKVTRKGSGYNSGPLPPDALHAFKISLLMLPLEQRTLLVDLAPFWPKWMNMATITPYLLRPDNLKIMK
jgi:hypothetical protein